MLEAQRWNLLKKYVHMFKNSNVDCDGNNILHLACAWGEVDLVKKILDKQGQFGVSLAKKNAEEQTPIAIAITRGHLELVRFLVLHCGENANQPCWEKDTCLQVTK